MLPCEDVGQRGERAHAQLPVQPVALAELLEQGDVALDHRHVEGEHLAALAHAAPRDADRDLAPRETLLDELADLVLEERDELGGPDRDLAEAVVDRAHLGGQALAFALQLGRAVPGHAPDHSTSPGVRGPRERRAIPESFALARRGTVATLESRVAGIA